MVVSAGSLRAAGLSGSSCGAKAGGKPLNLCGKKRAKEGEEEEVGNALTAESDRCTSKHRARKSRDAASCRRLFKSLLILGGK